MTRIAIAAALLALAGLAARGPARLSQGPPKGRTDVTGYYKKPLRANETVLHVGKLHWRVYLRPFGLFLVGPP